MIIGFAIAIAATVTAATVGSPWWAIIVVSICWVSAIVSAFGLCFMLAVVIECSQMLEPVFDCVGNHA